MNAPGVFANQIRNVWIGKAIDKCAGRYVFAIKSFINKISLLLLLFTGKHLTMLGGIGAEFAKGQNITMTRLGLEPMVVQSCIDY